MATKNNNVQVRVAVIGLIGAVLVVSIPLLWDRLMGEDRSTEKEKQISYQGYVKNKVTGAAVVGAVVSFLDSPTLTPKTTDSRGVFSMSLLYTGDDRTIRIQVEKDGYVSWNNYRLLTSKPEVEEILLEPIATEVKADVTNEKKQLKKFVSGYVTDLKGNRLADAEVTVMGEGAKAKTNGSGEFNISVNSDEPRISASKSGYVPWNDYVKAPKSGLIITLNTN